MPGRCLTLTNPYFKMGMHCKSFIRVEDYFGTLSFDSPGAPFADGRDSAAWRSLGNDFVAADDEATALQCYQNALAKSPEILLALLSNRSLCYLTMKEYKLALYNALVVCNLSPRYVTKPLYRPVVAL